MRYHPACHLRRRSLVAFFPWLDMRAAGTCDAKTWAHRFGSIPMTRIDTLACAHAQLIGKSRCLCSFHATAYLGLCVVSGLSDCPKTHPHAKSWAVLYLEWASIRPCLTRNSPHRSLVSDVFYLDLSAAPPLSRRSLPCKLQWSILAYFR